MPRSFIAFDPRSGRRDVVIEVHPELVDGATEADVQQLERRLYDRRIHLGILVTPRRAYFVRDTFSALEFSTESYDVGELDTVVLFSRTVRGPIAIDEGLYDQTKTWLDAVAGAWSSFVPDEALPFMLPEMIGGLAQSNMEEWDDVLDVEDAAQ